MVIIFALIVNLLFNQNVFADIAPPADESCTVEFDESVKQKDGQELVDIVFVATKTNRVDLLLGPYLRGPGLSPGPFMKKGEYLVALVARKQWYEKIPYVDDQHPSRKKPTKKVNIDKDAVQANFVSFSCSGNQSFTVLKDSKGQYIIRKQ